MVALTKNKPPRTRDGVGFAHPVAADTRIFQGALVALDGSGNAVPATAAGGDAVGFAIKEADNTGGAAGAIMVTVNKGVVLCANNGLDRTDLETAVSVTDDQTVGGVGAATAGTLVDLDAGGAWVRID
jgi:hypothetical protein